MFARWATLALCLRRLVLVHADIAHFASDLTSIVLKTAGWAVLA
tara:strand:- start:1927 stop:2058 length:132 start_codon:yes stop_codon:yes gene_type:complete